MVLGVEHLAEADCIRFIGPDKELGIRRLDFGTTEKIGRAAMHWDRDCDDLDPEAGRVDDSWSLGKLGKAWRAAKMDTT